MRTGPNIRMYDGVITDAFGPDEGPFEEVFYSAIAVNSPDLVEVTRFAPTRAFAPGTIIRKAPIEKPCRITLVNGSLKLWVEELEATIDCESAAPTDPANITASVPVGTLAPVVDRLLGTTNNGV